MSDVRYVYFINTQVGEFLFDQDLNHLTGDEYEPVGMLTFQQDALAPEEDWEDWAVSYTEQMLIDEIRNLIRRKMREIASHLELH